MTDSLGAGDVAATLLVSGASLVAVCVPFLRGLRVALRGLAATRRVRPSEIESRLRRSGTGRGDAEGEPVALQMLRVLQSALRENREEAWPTEFLVDASRQYVTNDWETSFARPISMYANLLPPIGFIGTTGGLLVLFLSMRVASQSLELGALAMALTSSIFALVGFAILEGLKARLYGRMLTGVDDALSVFRRASARSASAA